MNTTFLTSVMVLQLLGAGWVYKLKNWPACEKIVKKWLELERQRTFLEI